jgi:hypothetical protein
LTIFAGLSNGEQAGILEEIARLKKKAGSNPETFLIEVRTLAAMYGAIIEGVRGEEPKPEVFTARLEEITKAASGLQQMSQHLSKKK